VAAKIVANAIQSAENAASKAAANAARAQAAAKAKAEANAAAAQNAEARAAAKKITNEAIEKARKAADAEKAANNARRAAEAAAAEAAAARGAAVMASATKVYTNPMSSNSNSNSNSNAPSIASGNIENSIIRKLGKTNFTQVDVGKFRTNSRLNKSEQIYLNRIWAQKMFNQNYKNLMQIKGYAGGMSIQSLIARMQGYIRLMGPNANREPKMNSVGNILKYTTLMGKASTAKNPNVKRAFAIANKGWQNKTVHTANHKKLMNNLQKVYNTYYNASGKPRGSDTNIIRNATTLKRTAERRQYRTTQNTPTNYSKRGNLYQNNKGQSYITPNKGVSFYKVMGSQGGRYTVNITRKFGENII
jgi:hypothetical protein